MTATFEGNCHCGAVSWRMIGRPETATICNCSVCRRYGVIWAYGWIGQDIHISGAEGSRVAYCHGDHSLAFHHCATCGVVIDWTSLAPSDGPAGPALRSAVNLRMADMAPLRDVPLRLFDGAGKFEELPMDGRCIGDIIV